MAERPSDDGGTIGGYRYTGVSAPVMLPVDERWRDTCSGCLSNLLSAMSKLQARSDLASP